MHRRHERILHALATSKRLIYLIVSADILLKHVVALASAALQSWRKCLTSMRAHAGLQLGSLKAALERLKANIQSDSEAQRLRAWREACTLVQKHVPDAASWNPQEHELVCEMLRASATCSETFTGHHRDMQVQQAALQYSLVRALHQAQATVQVHQQGLALIQYLQHVCHDGSRQQLEAIWGGTLTATIATLSAVPQEGSFAMLCTAVLHGSDGKGADAGKLWPQAQRLIVARMHDEAPLLAQEDFQRVVQLLSAATRTTDMQKAERLVPHIVAKLSREDMWQLAVHMQAEQYRPNQTHVLSAIYHAALHLAQRSREHLHACDAQSATMRHALVAFPAACWSIADAERGTPSAASDDLTAMCRCVSDWLAALPDGSALQPLDAEHRAVLSASVASTITALQNLARVPQRSMHAQTAQLCAGATSLLKLYNAVAPREGASAESSVCAALKLCASVLSVVPDNSTMRGDFDGLMSAVSNSLSFAQDCALPGDQMYTVLRYCFSVEYMDSILEAALQTGLRKIVQGQHLMKSCILLWRATCVITACVCNKVCGS